MVIEIFGLQIIMGIFGTKTTSRTGCRFLKSQKKKVTHRIASDPKIISFRQRSQIDCAFFQAHIADLATWKTWLRFPYSRAIYGTFCLALDWIHSTCFLLYFLEISLSRFLSRTCSGSFLQADFGVSSANSLAISGSLANRNPCCALDLNICSSFT